MSILQAVVLGFIQGFTEFLPISSSAHLLIVPMFLRWQEQGIDFDVAVHVATLGAIVVALWGDVWSVIKKPRLFALIAAGTVPIVVFGLLISDDMIHALRGPIPVAISLIVWGVALVVADGAAKHHEQLPSLTRVSLRQTIFMGCAQVLALIPGTSRSGITMTAGMVTGLARIDAARYAFLLAVPSIAGAGILTLKDALETGFTTPMAPMLAGMLTAFLSGLLAIRLLMIVARKANFKWFALYRFALAIVILIFLA